jgi:hypothetical protein
MAETGGTTMQENTDLHISGLSDLQKLALSIDRLEPEYPMFYDPQWEHIRKLGYPHQEVEWGACNPSPVGKFVSRAVSTDEHSPSELAQS